MKLLLPRHKLGIKRRPEAPMDTLRQYHKFDEATGQVYTERTAAIQSSDDHDWAWQPYDCRPALMDLAALAACATWAKSKVVEGPKLFMKFTDDGRSKESESLKGARSLQDTAIECIVHNISDVTPEVLKHLPTLLVQRVWEEVSRRGVMSFNTWSMFSKLLREIPTPGLWYYRQSIEMPKSPLHIYTAPLSSESLDFITSLCITVAFPMPDLLKISNIPNLGSLEIVNPMCGTNKGTFGVGDRLVRGWHLAASNDGAFRVLRILRLWNHKDLTGLSLSFINSFPALAVYDVTGCSFELNATLHPRQLGWTPIVDTHPSIFLMKACIERVRLMHYHVESGSLQRICSRPFNDGTRLMLIPRVEIPDFLMKTIDIFSLDEYCAESKGPPRTRHFQTDTAADSLASCKLFGGGSTYSTFSKVGELRNDVDLTRAGVDVGDQVVMGDRLVSPVPVANLRIGQLYRLPSNTQLLAFIRIKLPPEASATTTKEHNHESEAGDTEASIKPKVEPKQQRPGVMKSKKRKLDDLLTSFL